MTRRLAWRCVESGRWRAALPGVDPLAFEAKKFSAGWRLRDLRAQGGRGDGDWSERPYKEFHEAADAAEQLLSATSR